MVDNPADRPAQAPEESEQAPIIGAPEAAATESAPITPGAVVTPGPTEPSEAVSADDATADNTLNDDVTSRAVDEITASESDTVLAVEDARAAGNAPADPAGWKAKLQALAKDRRTWLVIAGLLVVIFAVPVTRYKIVGLVIKRSVTVSVVDSTTHTPVSNAQVRLAGASAKTDANGKAKLHGSVGATTLTVTKQYYKTYTSKSFVGFKTQPVTASIVATGRQVPIIVTNKISGKPLSGAEIKVLDTTAKTDAHGQAILVLPTTATSDSGTVSLKGYNNLSARFQVTADKVAANHVQLTPAGQVYFLSNLNGTLDVVKTNLDGSGRKTILAGTGKEDPNTTSLLASRDWKYLVLKARRDTAFPSLYIIDTSTDKATQFDSGDSSFTLAGWYGHNFMYDVVRNNVSAWQSGHEVIKSYNAEGGQLNQLDQNQAEGTATAYAYQSFSNFYIVNGLLAYNTQWFSFDTVGSYDLSGKNDTIRGVQPNGQGKKDYQNFTAASTGYMQAAPYSPQVIYYLVYSNSDNKTTFYEFQNGAVTTDTSIDQTDFSKPYPTYLLSPAGNQTFWTELRDGKNTLFIGDANAQGKKQIASLSDYSPYGWYSDNYTLVSKSSSELYIMPAGGMAAGKTPLKITDYYKPAQTFNGYGYGYGGL